MAQSHSRQSTQHPPGHQDAAQHEPPAPPPAPMAPPRMPMAPVITDRQLVEQLRQIYQVANRHMPVPSSTDLSQSLCDTLEEIAGIAEKAVKGYKP